MKGIYEGLFIDNGTNGMLPRWIRGLSIGYVFTGY